jgi:hypothetical protein
MSGSYLLSIVNKALSLTVLVQPSIVPDTGRQTDKQTDRISVAIVDYDATRYRTSIGRKTHLQRLEFQKYSGMKTLVSAFMARKAPRLNVLIDRQFMVGNGRSREHRLANRAR